MSKIHKALKKSARNGGLDPENVPITPVDRSSDEEQNSEGGKITTDRPSSSRGDWQNERDADVRPDFPFKRVRSYRLEADELVLSLHDPKSMTAEQYRTLRTRIQRRKSEADERQVLLVTSPGMGEGKSLVSVNLSLTLAQEVDRRVILLDCDLRKPKVRTFLGLPSGEQPGIEDFLAGRVPLEKAVWRLSKTQLYIMSVENPPENPSELLGSGSMKSLLSYLRTQFDQVVLDAPPINPVADPAVLSTIVDGILLVVRFGKTGRDALMKAIDSIQREKILGIVFNGADLPATKHYYQYRY